MFTSQKVYQLCFRAARGLPLPARPLIKLIIESALARTQRDDKVLVCNYIWMGNHPHISLVSLDVNALKAFYCELKKRITDMLKRLLGLNTLHLWEAKEARVIEILDLDKAISDYVYYFLNPANAGLVESIDDYPGLSTWKAFCSCEPSVSAKVEYSVPWIRLPSLHALPSSHLSRAHEEQVIKQIRADNKSMEKVTIYPFAWLKVFGITEPEDIEANRRKIIERVREGEKELAEKRAKAGHTVIGKTTLELQPIEIGEHVPKKNERSIFFNSSIKELRIAYFERFREFCKRCRECYRLMCRGIKDVVWPHGAFVPPIPPLVNPLDL